jgi:hypothetical protein
MKLLNTAIPNILDKIIFLFHDFLKKKSMDASVKVIHKWTALKNSKAFVYPPIQILYF